MNIRTIAAGTAGIVFAGIIALTPVSASSPTSQDGKWSKFTPNVGQVDYTANLDLSQTKAMYQGTKVIMNVSPANAMPEDLTAYISAFGPKGNFELRPELETETINPINDTRTITYSVPSYRHYDYDIDTLKVTSGTRSNPATFTITVLTTNNQVFTDTASYHIVSSSVSITATPTTIPTTQPTTTPTAAPTASSSMAFIPRIYIPLVVR